MAADYDPTVLSVSAKDRARFQLGDRGTLRDESGDPIWLLQNEEIEGLIELHGYAEGVAQCADALAADFAQQPRVYADESGTRVDMSDRVATWLALAAQLRRTGKPDTAPTGGAFMSAQTTGPSMEGWR
jgi:hypothetical protein